jgi:hypothetical protein
MTGPSILGLAGTWIPISFLLSLSFPSLFFFFTHSLPSSFLALSLLFSFSLPLFIPSRVMKNPPNFSGEVRSALACPDLPLWARCDVDLD